jgi:hypothetical protein
MHQPNRLHVGRLRALAMAPGFLLALGFAAPGLEAQEPAGTIKVETHASKWDYPKELKVPEGSRTHLVEKGDTLWDLSGKYLGNPYAWPQIWELNQWIKDPHWIYPGDPLIIDLSRAVATAGSVPPSGDPSWASPSRTSSSFPSSPPKAPKPTTRARAPSP